MNLRQIFTFFLIILCTLANIAIMVLALFETINSLSTILPSSSLWNYLLVPLIGVPYWGGLTFLGKFIMIKICTWTGRLIGIKIINPLYQ